MWGFNGTQRTQTLTQRFCFFYTNLYYNTYVPYFLYVKFRNSNSHLLKHLHKQHTCRKLAAIAQATPPKQPRLDLNRLATTWQANSTLWKICSSTVESPAVSRLVSQISCAGGLENFFQLPGLQIRKNRKWAVENLREAWVHFHQRRQKLKWKR